MFNDEEANRVVTALDSLSYRFSYGNAFPPEEEQAKILQEFKADEIDVASFKELVDNQWITLRDLDISGWINFNRKYAREYAKRTGTDRYYFKYLCNYGGLIDGSDLERALVEGSDKSLSSARSYLYSILPPAFALSYALDCEKPDRVIGIMNGALGFVATTEFFGQKVDFVEAHRVGSANLQTYKLRTEASYCENFSKPLNADDRVLLLEDTSEGEGTTTYGFVIKELMQRHGIKRENISLFFGMPGHDYLRLDNPVRQFTKREVEAGKIKFYNFLSQEAYFLNYPGVHPVADIKESKWRVFKELSKRGDFESALKRFVERITRKF